MKSLCVILGLVVVFPACGDDNNSPATPPPLDFTGDFDTVGTWDLSGPIAAHESVGQGVARIFVRLLVERARAPSLIKDRLSEVLRAALLGPVASAVDAQTPPEWQVGGELHSALTMKLAAIGVETRLSLQGEPGALAGTERLTALSIPGDPPYSVDLTALDEDGSGVVSLVAPVTARVNGRRLTVDQHVFVVRFDRLITDIVIGDFGVDLGPLDAFLSGTIDCLALLASVDAADGVRFTIAGREFGFSGSALAEVCATAIGGLTGRTAGVFSRDTGVALWGTVTGTDVDGDGRADTLASDPGYGGKFTGLPIPGDIAITAAFTGRR